MLCPLTPRAPRRTAADPATGRALAPIFEQLPTPAELPDYYELIPEPVDLVGIDRRLRDGGYADLPAFQADVELMWANATTYNGPENPVHAAALALRELCRAEWPRLLRAAEKVQTDTDYWPEWQFGY